MRGSGPASLRARFDSWVIRSMDGYMHRRYAGRKRRLFADLPARLVELGAGAGANFRYLRPGTRVLAVEPNLDLHPDLIRAAERHQIELELRGCPAEQLDLPEQSVEAIIATLVLCTVRDPLAVLRNAHRLLRPGGRFLAIEHVAARRGSPTAFLQRALRRPWGFVFGGCRPDRDTARSLEQVGFRSLEVEPFTWRSLAWPVRPQIMVAAVR